MIAIINIGGKKNGVCKYRVQVNEKVICEFKHDRKDLLSECLKRAADAVESVEKDWVLDMHKKLVEMRDREEEDSGKNS